MIVILDTNVLHADAYAAGGGLTTLLNRAEGDNGLEVWLPKSVVEELVRQFPVRLERMRKLYGKIRYDLSALRLGTLAIPEAPEGVEQYRMELEQRFNGPHRKIADHPSSVGTVVDWAAQRRWPIKEYAAEGGEGETREEKLLSREKTRPVFGVVDAAIWLTVIEAAALDRVALVSRNADDFADPVDQSQLHPKLIEDLEAAGRHPSKVERFATITDFNQRYIDPALEAQAEADAFVSDGGKRQALEAAISDAVEWFPLELDSRWGLAVEIDESTLASFQIDNLVLVRGDRGQKGLYLTLIATGTARFDLGIRKSEAYGAPDSGPIQVNDWDWNDEMVQAEAELPGRLLVEVLVTEGKDLGVSIDSVDPA